MYIHGPPGNSNRLGVRLGHQEAAIKRRCGKLRAIKKPLCSGGLPHKKSRFAAAFSGVRNSDQR
jgi:hypothetical protein